MTDAHWFAIRAMLRHLLLCWPRRWKQETAPDGWPRRVCQHCGLMHDRRPKPPPPRRQRPPAARPAAGARNHVQRPGRRQRGPQGRRGVYWHITPDHRA